MPTDPRVYSRAMRPPARLLAPALAGCLVTAPTLGCAPAAVPPRPPLPDASFDADLDARIPVIEAGPRPDVPPLDAPLPDGAPRDAPPAADAGPAGIVVDGLLDEDAWTTASLSSTDVTPASPFDGCALTELRVLSLETTLVVAVTGRLAASCGAAGIVVYLDVDPLAGSGLLLDGAGGADTSGALNRVLSGPIFSVELLPDFAWGTLRMPQSRTTGAGDIGWRRVAVAPFSTPGGQLTACTAASCESSIPYASLGLRAGSHDVEVFARLGDGAFWAEPSIPPDFSPGTVTASLPVTLVVP